MDYREVAGAVTFSVKVTPRASRSGIVGEQDGRLRVRVAAPPVDGAANDELIRTLARALGVPARSVEIVGGQSARVKRVRVTGAERARLEGLAAGKTEK